MHGASTEFSTIMKTIFAPIVVALAILATSSSQSFAQNDYDSGTSYESSDATSVVYEAPVIYTAPVVYQAAVAYYAPVYYITAASTSHCCESPRSYSAPSSTVYVIGAHGGSYGYSKCSEYGASVVRFGEEGGWFGR